MTSHALSGIPVDFILFALTLLAVAVFHGQALRAAVLGLVLITAYQLTFTGFDTGAGLEGLSRHVARESVLLTNLFGLLVGFAVLADHFAQSRLPELLPNYLPDDWKGGLALLVLVFVLSSFLDNIAAAMIGGTIANAVFRSKIHPGYLAAIVAASNAGGSGSAVGDTTTTMMWIGGVHPATLSHAYVAAVAALLVCGVAAALQQQRFSPIIKTAARGVRLDHARLGIVVVMLFAAIASNVLVSVRFPQSADRFPFMGAALWLAILATAPLRQPAWKVLPQTARNAAFLLSLVMAASLMPVERLPAPSWPATLSLGFVSAVFDNIPLTKLALKQGGYDWGCLAYAVGFGGSMIWFGSSAGVALAASFPGARSAGAWLRQGWHVTAAYVSGFAVLLWVLGWQAQAAVQ